MRLWQEKGLSRKFTSLKWEAKNTYLIMPARRLYGGLFSVKVTSGKEWTPIIIHDAEKILHFAFSERLMT